MPGDTEPDGDIDIFDVLNINIFLGGVFPSPFGIDADWPDGDFNNSDQVDIFDILLVNQSLAQIGGLGSTYAVSSSQCTISQRNDQAATPFPDRIGIPKPMATASGRDLSPLRERFTLETRHPGDRSRVRRTSGEQIVGELALSAERHTRRDDNLRLDSASDSQQINRVDPWADAVDCVLAQYAFDLGTDFAEADSRPCSIANALRGS